MKRLVFAGGLVAVLVAAGSITATAGHLHVYPRSVGPSPESSPTDAMKTAPTRTDEKMTHPEFAPGGPKTFPGEHHEVWVGLGDNSSGAMAVRHNGDPDLWQKVVLVDHDCDVYDFRVDYQLLGDPAIYHLQGDCEAPVVATTESTVTKYRLCFGGVGKPSTWTCSGRSWQETSSALRP